MRPVLALAVVGLIAACTIAEAQDTGTPLWGSFESGPFDTVNRQNLNVNFACLSLCSGRGESFNSSLVYDSLIWTKAGARGLQRPTRAGTQRQVQKIISHSVRFTIRTTIASATRSRRRAHRTISHTPTLTAAEPYTSSAWGLISPRSQRYAASYGPRTGYATDGSGYYLDATSPSYPIVKSPR